MNHFSVSLRGIVSNEQMEKVARAVVVQLREVIRRAKLIFDLYSEALVLATPRLEVVGKLGERLAHLDRLAVPHGAHSPGGDEQDQANDKHACGHFATPIMWSSRLTPSSSAAAMRNTPRPPAVWNTLIAASTDT